MKNVGKTAKALLAFAIICAFSQILPAVKADAASLEFSDLKPRLLKVSSYSDSQIKLSWERLDKADGYQIWRSDSKTGKYKLVYTTVHPKTAGFINGHRTIGKTYYYKIRAYMKKGNNTYYSGYSKVMSAYPRPEKVTGLSQKKGESTYCGRFDITWKKVEGASGYEARISYKKTDGTWSDWSKTAENSYEGKVGFYGISGYSNWKYIKADQDGKTYRFRVRAYRKVNGKNVYGLWSDPLVIAPDLDGERLSKELTEYIISEYPDFEYYDDFDSYEKLDPDNGSFFSYGEFRGISAYSDYDEALELEKSNIDEYMLEHGGTLVGGCFYLGKLMPHEEYIYTSHTGNSIVWQPYMLY